VASVVSPMSLPDQKLFGSIDVGCRMRSVLTLVILGILTFLMVLLVQGDGPGSQDVLFGISRHHGVNGGDLPVLGAWLVGVAATVTLHFRR
jgi:hypothetical protein